MLLALAAATLALLAPAVTSAQDGLAPTPVEVTEGRIQVLYLGNAGFLLRSGDFGVLIDAFVEDEVGGFEALPAPAIRQLEKGERPFDGVVLSLVSHFHRDHFQPRLCESYLRANPKASVMTSPEVLSALKAGAEDFKALRSQLVQIRVPPGERRAVGESGGGAKVEFLGVPHPGVEGGMAHFAHLVELGGFRVLHVGDAEPRVSVFEPFAPSFVDLDVAIVPSWFFTSEEGVRVLEEVLRPAHTIVCHVPAADRELFRARMELENPHVIVFGQRLESKIFDRSPPPGAAEPSESDG